MDFIHFHYRKVGRIALVQINDKVGGLIDSTSNNRLTYKDAINYLINPSRNQFMCHRIVFAQWDEWSIHLVIESLKKKIDSLIQNNPRKRRGKVKIREWFDSMVKVELILRKEVPFDGFEYTIQLNALDVFQGIYQSDVQKYAGYK